MSRVDRRRIKTQETIKNAIIELISEKSFADITMHEISDKANVSRGTIYSFYVDKFDLLEKLIEEHLHEMEELHDAASELDYIDANQIWFDYIKENFLFFSAMLASSGVPHFRTQFLGFLSEQFKNEIKVNTGKNRGLNEEIILQFIVMSYIGIVEWWVKNEMPYPPYLMAEQVGVLLERNL
ncbi:TetR/AcrR family transcriptional regulator [Lederbergia panacisoli]|uniref:TetR/AcrR family transcriptional regulator n=1 Tax=Lederbergia panacisoli TaxID=1255251 RepID=UPI00214B9327|nr:TetR/AcrR family transcriptional regulator [Lederbergia panacisoli]MCR2821665.1 TetR/AcrR family transcriptional regulator [Lederbergia panacisoli]